MNDDLDKLGKLIWEGSKIFSFVKIQGTESVLGTPHVTILFALLLGGRTYTHTEIITIDTIQQMSDPVTVVKAIQSKLKQDSRLPTTG
jgi:hypothetical protein